VWAFKRRKRLQRLRRLPLSSQQISSVRQRPSHPHARRR
jgi:hypothetical protein